MHRWYRLSVVDQARLVISADGMPEHPYHGDPRDAMPTPEKLRRLAWRISHLPETELDKALTALDLDKGKMPEGLLARMVEPKTGVVEAIGRQSRFESIGERMSDLEPSTQTMLIDEFGKRVASIAAQRVDGHKPEPAASC